MRLNLFLFPRPCSNFEPGGVLHEHIRRWQALAASGDDVEIRGLCGSACTLIMAYVSRERICFGEAASLGFHLARKVTAEAKDPYGVGDIETSRWMLNQYPQDIRTWIKNKGGFEWMSVGDSLTLDAVELWAMGYRKCEPDELPVPMRILRSSSSSPKTNQVTNFKGQTGPFTKSYCGVSEMKRLKRHGADGMRRKPPGANEHEKAIPSRCRCAVGA